EANAFDWLRAAERAGERFDTIVLDPPAFAKSRQALTAALRGYKDVNLRAMRLLQPGGLLFTASCSYHLTKPLFIEMLQSAAADSGRRLALREMRGQPLDHPEILSIPEPVTSRARSWRRWSRVQAFTAARQRRYRRA